MEPNVYKLIVELHEKVVGDGRKILSSSDIAALEASLHALVTVYGPDDKSPTPHDTSEARRPPARAAKKEAWWQKF